MIEAQAVLNQLKRDILQLPGTVSYVDGGGDVMVMVRMPQEMLPVGVRPSHPLREERRNTAGHVRGDLLFYD